MLLLLPLHAAVLVVFDVFDVLRCLAELSSLLNGSLGLLMLKTTAKQTAAHHVRTQPNDKRGEARKIES